MSASKLFISHAAADIQIVDEFVDLLESGVGVPMDNIFCTSRKGQSIPAGSDFKEAIRSHLDDATTVLALISPNFYASAFCMCELGAAWVLARGNFIPILVPPLSFRDAKAVLIGLQTLKLNDVEDLDELKDDLTKRLGIKPNPTPRWTKKRDRFLEKLPSLHAPAPPTVDKKKLERALKQRDDYADALTAAEAEKEKLQEQLAKVSALKDRAQVRKIKEDSSDHQEVFKARVEAARAALGGLYPITREVFCWHYTSDTELDINSPSHVFDHDDALRATQYNQITVAHGTAELNLDNNKTRRAHTALNELEQWIEAAPPEFHEEFEEAHDYDLSLNDREFWDQYLTR